MNRLSVFFCGVILSALPSIPAWADTIYTYTGNHFTMLNYAPIQYSLSDSIDLSFDVASPLGANLSNGLVIPTSYTITDGVETYDDVADPKSVFLITTNASGKIIFWNIDLESKSFKDVFTFWDPEIVGEDGALGDFGDGAWNIYDPGTWSSATTPSATPEPSSLLLLGSGALGLVGIILRRLSPGI